ncbi:MAG: hypothetical protein JO261_07510 [Alphaproteobacteria bacterium]|nr:hypothetical protein [Alphaproteobacteria bacterium]MBV9693529.1 hypothetical protein [Alphaproteobacteria bacterium]
MAGDDVDAGHDQISSFNLGTDAAKLLQARLAKGDDILRLTEFQGRTIGYFVSADVWRLISFVFHLISEGDSEKLEIIMTGKYGERHLDTVAGDLSLEEVFGRAAKRASR